MVISRARFEILKKDERKAEREPQRSVPSYTV